MEIPVVSKMQGNIVGFPRLGVSKVIISLQLDEARVRMLMKCLYDGR